jgi:TonB-linked SusC/RagA family outer membrane protein
MNFYLTNSSGLLSHRILKTIMRTFIFLFCSVVFSFNPNNGFSQNAEINIESDKTISVQDIFKLIKKQTQYQFVYDVDMVKEAPEIEVKKGIVKAGDLLKKGLNPIQCTFEFANNTVIVRKIIQNTVLIEGRVSDKDDQPILGITIIYKEYPNKGTSTDIDGRYQILVNKEEPVTLQFSGIGFATKEVSVNNQTTINVTLQNDLNDLEEVVIVGYGKTSRKKLTGAVTTINTKAIQRTQNVLLADALVGVVPGLLVQEGFDNPDTPPSILLRGVGSIVSDNSPLIVVDGVQMPPDAFSNGLNFTTINRNDIESINILKDAAATSIYGSRGSNGVVLITTKRGRKNSKLQVDFNTRIGFRNPDRSFTDDLMNATQKLDYEESLGLYDTNPEDLEERRNSGNNTNWSDLLIDNEVNINHDIAISGGSENSNYYSSISYTDVDNIFGSNYERYTVAMRADFDFTDKLKLGLSGNFGNVNNKDRRGVGDPFSNAFLLNPWEQVFDDSGNPTREITHINDRGTPFNPLFIRNNTNIESVRKNIGGSANLTYKPIEWLTLNGVLGLNYNTSKRTRYQNIIVSGGALSLTNSNNNNYTGTLTATVDKTFDNHSINLVLGNEYNENESSSITNTARDFQSDAVQTISAGETSLPTRHLKSNAGSVSYFSRLNYSFNNTYNLSLSYRRDGSSRFGDNNKYANFWAIGASWNIYNDFFRESSGTLSSLKLRFSTGTSGNDFIGNFASQSLYRFDSPNTYNNANVAILSRGENADLTWEKNENTNFGLDFGFFGNRVNGSIDYYIRTTKDLLTSVQIPLTSGFDLLTDNLGNFKNKGFEIALNTINVENSNFKWTTNFTFSSNKGEVISLTEDRNLIVRGSAAYKPGSPINALYIADWTGVNPDTGFNQYRDTDGNLIDYNTDPTPGSDNNREEISQLREVSDKTSIPKYHGGVTNTFTYKNFDTSFLVSFSGGNYIINGGIHNLYNNARLNQHVDVLNAWKEPGDQTNIAVRVPETVGGAESDFEASSQFLQDASYIKLKNFVIGYTINKDITEKIGIDRLRIFAQGQNLFTITDVDYIDPEFATATGGIGLSSSINRGFSFGINANF